MASDPTPLKTAIELLSAPGPLHREALNWVVTVSVVLGQLSILFLPTLAQAIAKVYRLTRGHGTDQRPDPGFIPIAESVVLLVASGALVYLLHNSPLQQ